MSEYEARKRKRAELEFTGRAFVASYDASADQQPTPQDWAALAPDQMPATPPVGANAAGAASGEESPPRGDLPIMTAVFESPGKQAYHEYYERQHAALMAWATSPRRTMPIFDVHARSWID